MGAQRSRRQLRNEDFVRVGALERPLNDLLLQIQQRLEAVENSAQKRFVLSAEFDVTSSALPGGPPWPVLIATPQNFTPLGLTLLQLENLSNPGYLESSSKGHSVRWRNVPNGIELQYVTGLDVSTRYRVTLEAIGNG